LAQRAKGKRRSKMPELERALEGDFRKEHAFLVKRLLMQTRFLENQEQALRRAIQSRLTPPKRQAVALWDTIPGVNEAVAWTLVAGIGTRPEQFLDADHLASWVALCPGNNTSAGKRYSGKIRKGNPWLRAALSEAAWAAPRPTTPTCRLSAAGSLPVAARNAPSLLWPTASRSAPVRCSNPTSLIAIWAPTISTRSSPNKLRSGSSNAYRNSDMKCL
jgi:hypothetical protein